MRTILSVLFIGFTAGCLDPNLSVPAGAEVTCTWDRDCPVGLRCSTLLEMCVDSRSDGYPPEILPASVQLTPTMASSGQLVELIFDVSEPLATTPDVYLVIATGNRPMMLYTSSGQSYAFRYTAAGDEPTGAPVRIEANLIDTVGNQATGITVAQIQFSP